MKIEPVKYKRIDRDPVGCFTAEMTGSGWANTKFDHNLQERLLSDEASEFIRLLDQFFRQCKSWKELQSVAKKHGTEIRNPEGSPIICINYLCDQMDYTFQVNGCQLSVFPYRKFQH